MQFYMISILLSLSYSDSSFDHKHVTTRDFDFNKILRTWFYFGLSSKKLWWPLIRRATSLYIGTRPESVRFV